MFISSLVSVTWGFISFIERPTGVSRMLFTLWPPSAKEDLLLLKVLSCCPRDYETGYGELLEHRIRLS